MFDLQARLLLEWVKDTGRSPSAHRCPEPAARSVTPLAATMSERMNRHA